MNECMNEGRLNYRLISMCVCIYVSLLHDSASGGARTALAPCLETWLAPWLSPRPGSRPPTFFFLALIILLILVGSLQYVHIFQRRASAYGILLSAGRCRLPPAP